MLKNGSEPWKNTNPNVGQSNTLHGAPHGGSNVGLRPWVFPLALEASK